MTRPAAGGGALPLLPLRDLVVFPGMTLPLIVGRPRSRAALAAAWEGGRRVLLVTQRAAVDGEPGPDDVHEVGTVAEVLQLLRLPDDNLKVLVEGIERARWSGWAEAEGCVRVAPRPLAPEAPAPGPALEAAAAELRELFGQYARVGKGVPPEMLVAIEAIGDPGALADTLVGHLPGFTVDDRQALLAEPDVAARLARLRGHLSAEIEVLQIERKIQTRVRKQAERGQKEQLLHDQLQALQRDGGERDELRAELAELEARIRDKPLSDEARDRLDRELRKLRQMSPMSAEATVVRTYIDQVLALPWQHFSEEAIDLRRARQVLDDDHHGLEKVKERILEHLAVASLVDRPRGPVLCLVGPPGVGKTSLARSIADAMGREYVRQALGGVRDEAEIRGHRRTYIGALPGKIIQSLKRAGRSNPVFLLDEVDKMSTDFRGDPSAALLEVLDPEQNGAFVDHYLDLDYDLSRVMFICTANDTTGIPAPLQDRLEIIRLPGYTEEEKLAIGRRYLLPRQTEGAGLVEAQLRVTDAALLRLVREYTREAGVRGLEREVARLCRRVAVRVVEEGPQVRVEVDAADLPAQLGVPPHPPRAPGLEPEVGRVHGLAVSPWGGEVLDIEVAVLPGKGGLQLTGRLGDWLKESAQAGFSYLRSRADALGLPPDLHEGRDVHLHYPGSALRTDGPSAGTAMATALISAFTGIPVRGDLAMTGEITLRGRVLPIGGLKEKLMAALRRGIRVVLIPEANAPELAELPDRLRQELEIVPVAHMDEVLSRALCVPAGHPLAAQRAPDEP